MILKDRSVSDLKKVIYLVGAGVAGVALGWLWGLQFPVIKKIWTSSYVLVTGGYSALLMAFFYLVVDIWKYRKWVQPFVWIGVNAITIYMAVNLIDVSAITRRFIGGDPSGYCGIYAGLLVAVVNLILVFGLVKFLYRRKIFLRL